MNHDDFPGVNLMQPIDSQENVLDKPDCWVESSSSALLRNVESEKKRNAHSHGVDVLVSSLAAVSDF